MRRAGNWCSGYATGPRSWPRPGLIPGTFTLNAYPKFICRPVYLRVDQEKTPFTSFYRKGEVIRIPIAHAEGRYVAPAEVIRGLNDTGRIVFRFCDEKGNVSPESNPNGSMENITGVISPELNVLAMMPHPERASEKILGSEDGKKVRITARADVGSALRDQAGVIRRHGPVAPPGRCDMKPVGGEK